MTGDPLTEVFERVRREDFLPADQRRLASHDAPLPIGHGQTNSQPSTVRAMLELLEIRRGQRVLDVGCGSGWTTALIAHLVGPDGEVTGVELVPELVTWGRTNLAAYDLPWARIEQAEEGVLGWPGGAPYDRVLVSAEATRLPGDLVDQLAGGGVLVAPVRGRMTVVRRTDVGTEVSEAGWYSFVPLIEP